MNQRPKFPAALSATVLALAAASANAQIANGGFGGLSGWSTAGDVAAVASGGNHLVLTNAAAGGGDDVDERNRNLSGTDPLSTGGGIGSLESFVGLPGGAFDPNTYTLQAYEGSAASQTFSLAAGGTLSFQWNFATTETSGDGNLADFAFVLLDGQLFTLANTLNASPLFGTADYAAQTGWYDWSTALAAGSHTIAFGIVDVGSYGGSSALSIANLTLGVSAVPESSSLAMVGAGLGLLALMQRRRRVR